VIDFVQLFRAYFQQVLSISALSLVKPKSKRFEVDVYVYFYYGIYFFISKKALALEIVLNDATITNYKRMKRFKMNL